MAKWIWRLKIILEEILIKTLLVRVTDADADV